MVQENGWTVQVLNALQAHFKQPDGTSKLGRDFWVVLRSNSEEKRILVRAYADDAADATVEQDAALVLEYVVGLLNGGWLPSQYRGVPGELVVERRRALPASRKQDRRRWWQFWRR